MLRYRKYLIIIIALLVLLPLVRMGYRYKRSALSKTSLPESGRRQVSDGIAQVGDSARARLRPHFDKARVPYAPGRVSFLAFKQEKTLELWAEKGLPERPDVTSGRAGPRWIYIRTYPVLAASGKAGPKLREGDRQVPEGIYRVLGLNPNSAYHLSIKINYPNNFDQQKAAQDRRTDLGGDIFVHGKNVSIGCLAMGDEAIEELFTLLNDVGVNQVRVIIAPNDMRKMPASLDLNIPWLPELYGILSQELKDYR
ncbi:MAG: L,D-transpeptidase family protein [Candidatus Brocadiia bacterium]